MESYNYIIKQITIDNKICWHVSVRPPMSNEDYDAIKYSIESVGGHWRERFGGFIFTEDPSNIDFNLVVKTPINPNTYRKWQINRQFYPTPPNIAKRVVELAEIGPEDFVLEPSAGRGGLLIALPEATKGVVAVEIDKNNADFLKGLGYFVINSSFEDFYEAKSVKGITRVVMNPPFSGQRDIKHILMAYDMLEEGGVLVAIMSENDLYYNTSLTKEFNRFLRSVDAYIEDIPIRGFLESQTSVDTVIVKIHKK